MSVYVTYARVCVGDFSENSGVPPFLCLAVWYCLDLERRKEEKKPEHILSVALLANIEPIQAGINACFGETRALRTYQRLGSVHGMLLCTFHVGLKPDFSADCEELFFYSGKTQNLKLCNMGRLT